MAEDSDPRRHDDTQDRSGSDRRESGPAPSRERDFGDSAGYGTGGSALDFHEVGDEDANPVKGKHNPLDDITSTNDGGPSTESPGGS
jgi:hypothetical protein